MKVTSPSFILNYKIPIQYSCQGKGISPALVIEGIPGAAKSLALIVDDPDAPMQSVVHWVVFNIPVTGEKFVIQENLVPGTQGINDFGQIQYGAPCPPAGTHRYFFKVYALDDMLYLQEGVNKEELEKAMNGHIIEQAEVMGIYKKL